MLRQDSGRAPLFSLIVSTIGRDAQLQRLCRSLIAQSLRDFELVVIDQSQGGAMRAVLDPFMGEIDIVYLDSRRGLSHGRNVGMAAARGRILCFPDDDCWYRPDTLATVAGFFQTHPDIHLLSGSATDEKGVPIGRWDTQAGEISRRNVLRRCISITLFARREVVSAVGGFDERIGAGSGTAFGSGEETDFLLRAMDAGCRAWFDPALVIHHPDTRWGDTSGDKAYMYGTGMGLLIRRHGLGARALLPSLIRPLGGSLLMLAQGKPDRAWYYWRSMNGRLWGWRHARRLSPKSPVERETGVRVEASR